MGQSVQDELAREIVKRVYGEDREKWDKLLDDNLRELATVTMAWEQVIRLEDRAVADIVPGVAYDERRGKFKFESPVALLFAHKMRWCEDMRVRMDLMALAIVVDAAMELMGRDCSQED